MAPPAQNESLPFTGPSHTLQFSGLLFDMDGTIIDSTEAIVKHWHAIGRQLGVDPEQILHDSHGRRSVDTLKMYDEKLATWENVLEMEGRIPREYGDSAVEIPGSRALLESLEAARAPWMIVTSGTRPLLTGWLDVMKLAVPPVVVVAEDVAEGKPHPQCYQLGAERLGLGSPAETASKQILVLEDAPAGVKAGKAAGFKVVGLATTHDVKRLQDAGADWIVRDLRSVTLEGWDKGSGLVTVKICDTLAA
ncbi:hypothetical protein FH972_025444 [Carpinus fangiana]|uniref:Uncharacterized protein n=1 Tax=Carpinus fangiana TaxID=176857 RepID=A0A5N6L159_9ROSI|nr:hypothetical protein FH972_025444 [Carpinus fangiana]